MCASSSSLSISRRTSTGGGVSEPGGAVEIALSSVSPLIHERIRLRRGAAVARTFRRTASGSIDVTPGTWGSCSAATVAPHDGHVARSEDGSSAEHHGQRAAAALRSEVMSPDMADTLAILAALRTPRSDQAYRSAGRRLAYSHSIVAGGLDEMS